MANIVTTSVYKINQRPAIVLTDVTLIGFPTQGCVLTDTTGSPQRDLGNGITVYTGIKVAASGDTYYVQQTIATMATLFG